MNEKSLLDYAYDVLVASDKPLKFIDLFNESVKLSGLQLSESEMKSKVAKLYTQLSLDGRFINLTDNQWDLCSRYKFDETHLDMNDAYSDDDEDDIDDEEAKLLRQELGEDVAEEESDESDDLDFDKPIKEDDSDEDF